PFTFRTRPLPEKNTGRATAVRRASREQFVTGHGKRSIPAVGLRDLDDEPSPAAWAAPEDSANSAQQPPSRKDSL
ncbi:hypothetical protein, partial [Actinomadura sp. KC216]|uniref:hypothetical protein n=1 Tax=Actinomadura sp. KC216 TaxID=2530370 RepID=UPI0014047900